MKNFNPVINEFKRLDLIKIKNLSILANTCRDKKIKVLQDNKSKIILLEKYLAKNNHYRNDRNYSPKEIKKYLENFIEDEKRREINFSKFLKKKSVLDFGCEFGTFLNRIKSYDKCGVELNLKCLQYIKNNFNDIYAVDDLKKVKQKFDTITMFHVLEHMPHQVKILKKIKKKLKKGGNLIIEVPSANDFLLSIDNLKIFKSFTFWSEHLVLHTHISLKKVLKKAGFRKIKIIHYQRYNLHNHLKWFLQKKPAGHKYPNQNFNFKILNEYELFLKRSQITDTLVGIATS